MGNKRKACVAIKKKKKEDRQDGETQLGGEDREQTAVTKVLNHQTRSNLQSWKYYRLTIFLFGSYLGDQM